MVDSILAFQNAVRAAIGFAPEQITPGQLQRFATSPRKGDNAGWCQLFDGGRAGAYGDFRSGKTLVWKLQGRGELSRRELDAIAERLARAKAQRDAERRVDGLKNARLNAALWAECMLAVDGDPVSLYLTHRGLHGPVPKHLRLHPAMAYWHDGQSLGTFPAMVAPLIGSHRRMLALHRTYLTCDGRKAPVPIVKKLTRTSDVLSGTSIPLHEPQDGVIGIAEGIETAQAAWLASGVPTVAAYCANNLGAYVWPTNVNRIVVFADSDVAGAKAAQILRNRAVQSGVHATIMTPTSPGMDWCDVWVNRPINPAASEEEA